MNEDVKGRILLIENDRTLLVAVRDYLESRGYEVRGASSGEEGLKIAQQEKPDLIVLDLMLGQLTGVDVLRSIREGQGWGQQVKIVVLTGLMFIANLKEVRRLSDRFIAKSDFEMETLADLVKALLA